MEYIIVGVIVNTHGLKGTVKVKSFTDFKDVRYEKGARLYIAFKNEYIPVTVTNLRTVKGMDYLDFEEFQDINQIERYKGCDVVIPKQDLHELEEDEFYFDELVGMIAKGDTFTGEVVDVREVPRGQLLVIAVNQKEILVPFVKEFIRSVDKTTNTIYVIEWEGLL